MALTSSLWDNDLAAGTSRDAKWLYCPITTLDSALNNTSYVPKNATITGLRLYIRADQESVGANVYLKYGFGGTSSISEYLYGSSSGDGNKVSSSPADYPSGGVDIKSYLRGSPGSYYLTKDYGSYLSFRFISGNYLGKTYFVESVKLDITYQAHSHSYSTEISRTSSTCYTKGSVTKQCSCGETQKTELSLDPNNHAGGTEIRNAYSATCTSNGYTGDTYCKGCGVKISSGSTIQALGHSYNHVVTKPTESSGGYTTHICQRTGCGYSYADNYTYLVTFKNDNNITIGNPVEVSHGGKVTPPAAPEKADTNQFDYTFSHWEDQNKNIWASNTTITQSTTYTAKYSYVVQKYTVKWLNYDNSILETDEGVAFGAPPNYNSATPTKPDSNGIRYVFAGWDYGDLSVGISPELGTDVIIKALYKEEDINYIVRWFNEGVEIETDTWVAYNSKPDYNGDTPQHSYSEEWEYTFAGWSTEINGDTGVQEPDLENVTTENICYYAVYYKTKKLYTITVKQLNSEPVSTWWEYGSEVIIEAEDKLDIGYKFVRWSDGDTNQSRTIIVTKSSSEIVYEAEYELLRFNVIWKNDDEEGTILELDENVLYGSVPVYNGETPTKEPTAKYSYTFDGWDKEIIPVTKETVYTAKYKTSINSYLVEGTTDRGGKVTGTGTYTYGSTVYLVASPLPGYRFVKWHDGDTSNIKEVYVTGEVSYLAIFIAQNIYRGLNTFVNPYIGLNPNIAVYKGLNRIYG